MNIDKNIWRCKELIKTEHSNWIGLTNQEAISNVLSDREMWKKIAEFLAKKVSETGECYFISPKHCEKYSDKSCDECIVQCILDWAKREVANDKQS